jgi:hypothetical protein
MGSTAAPPCKPRGSPASAHSFLPGRRSDLRYRCERRSICERTTRNTAIADASSRSSRSRPRTPCWRVRARRSALAGRAPPRNREGEGEVETTPGTSPAALPRCCRRTSGRRVSRYAATESVRLARLGRIGREHPRPTARFVRSTRRATRTRVLAGATDPGLLVGIELELAGAAVRGQLLYDVMIDKLRGLGLSLRGLSGTWPKRPGEPSSSTACSFAGSGRRSGDAMPERSLSNRASDRRSGFRRAASVRLPGEVAEGRVRCGGTRPVRPGPDRGTRNSAGQRGHRGRNGVASFRRTAESVWSQTTRRSNTSSSTADPRTGRGS